MGGHLGVARHSVAQLPGRTFSQASRGEHLGLHAHRPVRHLVAAVVHERDLESATSGLAARGITATHMRSTGGFLRQTSHVLLLGIPEGKMESAMEALARACRDRAEIAPSPFGTNGAPAEILVRGATVFAFDVERYEELVR